MLNSVQNIQPFCTKWQTHLKAKIISLNGRMVTNGHVQMDWFTAKVTWWWKAEGINSLASGTINSLWMLQSYCDLGIYWTKTGNGGYQWGNNAEVCTVTISSAPHSYMHCAEMLPEDNQAQTSVSHLHFSVCVTEQLCAEENFDILENYSYLWSCWGINSNVFISVAQRLETQRSSELASLSFTDYHWLMQF